MHEHSVDLLKIAFDLTIVASVIILGFLLTRTGIAASNQANNGASDLAKQTINYSITKYDNEIVSGIEVISLIDKYKDSVEINIQTQRYAIEQGDTRAAFANYTTNAGATTTVIDSSLLDDIYYSDDEKFIDSEWQFYSYVEFDANDVLKKLTFIQKQANY